MSEWRQSPAATPTLSTGADGVRRILEDLEAEFRGEGRDLLALDRLAGEVDRHDYLWKQTKAARPGKLVPQRRKADVPCPWIDVDEVDGRPAIKRAIRGCDEGVGNRP